MKFEFEVYADFFQFFIQDEQAQLISPPSDLWDEPAYTRRLAVTPGLVGVRTERNDYVPVVVELVPGEPEDHADDWNHIAEGSLDVSFGRIVIVGRTEMLPLATRISVRTGPYRVRVYYGGLSHTSDSNDTHIGTDHYYIAIWSDVISEPKTLKSWE